MVKLVKWEAEACKDEAERSCVRGKGAQIPSATAKRDLGNLKAQILMFTSPCVCSDLDQLIRDRPG